MEAPKRSPKSFDWPRFADLSDLVWQEFPGLADGAKRLWDVLARAGLLDREADLTAAGMARALGKSHSASGHRAIQALHSAGLLIGPGEHGTLDHDPVTGIFSKCSLTDPLGALGPHRQARYRRGERSLPGLDLDAESLAGGDSTAQEAPASQVVRMADARELLEQTPARPAPGHASGYVPDGDPGGGLAAARAQPQGPQLSNLEGRSIYKPQLSAFETLRAPSGEVSSAPCGGARAAARPPTAAAAPADTFAAAAAALLAGPDPLAGKVAWLRERIPGLWLEIAEWVVDEVAGLHAGESRFDADELAKIVGRTRGAEERGELRRPPAVYFAGACRQRFAQLHRPWPKFRPGKPR